MMSDYLNYALEELEERERAKESLSEFIKQAWYVLHPVSPYIHNWHIDAIAEHLEAITYGKITRLLVNVPPGTLKPVSNMSMILEKTKGRIPLKDVKINDEILTHKGRFKKVLSIHNQGILPLIEITTHSGRKLKLAYDHPLLTPGGWKQAQHITTDDFLAEIHQQEDCGTRTITNEEARLLGYLVGDGCVKYQTASFTNQDEKTLVDFEYCAKKIGFRTRVKKIPPSVRNKMPKASIIVLLPVCKIGKNKWHVSSCGPHPVWSWLEKHNLKGKCSYDKRVPSSIMAGNNEIIANYLGAYWACDGTIGNRNNTYARKGRPDGQFHKNIKCSATTVSKELAFDHQHLLTRLGITSRVRTRSSKLKTKAQGDIYYSYDVDIGTENQIAKFGELIPIYHTKKKQLINYKRKDFSRAINSDKVVKIEKIESGECQCLTVEDDHSFTIQDIAVHNSLLVNVFWPAWEWGPKKIPEMSYLCAAHMEKLAIRDNMKMRRLVSSEWYKNRYPHVVLTNDRNSKSNFENTETGFREAMAIGSLTGSRSSRVTIDDPLSAEDVTSNTKLDNADFVFSEVIPTRLVDPIRSSIIVIMQRLHERDTSGIILSRNLGYEHLCLPMEFEPLRRCTTSIGFSDPRKEDGELLFPQRFPKEVVERDKKILGIYATAGQFQQRPSPRGGGLIKEEWLSQRYKLLRDGAGKIDLKQFSEVYQSWDTAFKEGEENDYSVCTTWGLKDNKIHLIHIARMKMDFPTLEKKAIELAAHFSPNQILIEDKASGQSLVQAFKRKTRLPVKAVIPQRDKIARVNSVTGYFEAMRIWLPENEPWLIDYIDELTTFPAGAHDDQVDSTTQFFIQIILKREASLQALQVTMMSR